MNIRYIHIHFFFFEIKIRRILRGNSCYQRAASPARRRYSRLPTSISVGPASPPRKWESRIVREWPPGAQIRSPVNNDLPAPRVSEERSLIFRATGQPHAHPNQNWNVLIPGPIFTRTVTQQLKVGCLTLSRDLEFKYDARWNSERWSSARHSSSRGKLKKIERTADGCRWRRNIPAIGPQRQGPFKEIYSEKKRKQKLKFWCFCWPCSTKKKKWPAHFPWPVN